MSENIALINARALITCVIFDFLLFFFVDDQFEMGAYIAFMCFQTIAFICAYAFPYCRNGTLPG